MANLRELTWKVSGVGFKKLAQQIKGVNKPLDESVPKFTGFDNKLKNLGSNLRRYGKNINGFGKDINGFGQNISKLGTKLTKVTAPLTAVGAAGFKMSMDLDTAIRQVSTLTDEGIMPIKQLKEDIKSISSDTGIDQKEIANSMYEALSSGVDQTKVAEFTKSAVNLTDAGFTDMTTAIDATTTVLNAYGDAAYDVTKIHDIMVKTQDKGKITVDQLGQNMGRVIPAASNLGVNLDQLGTAYSMLTAKGQNPQIATTNLNALFNELGKSGSNVDKVLRKKTGKSFKELTNEGTNVGEVLDIVKTEAEASGQSLSDMFGSMNAGNAALTLLSEGTEGYNALLKEMQESDGTAAANAEKMVGQQKRMRIAMNQVKIAMTDVGAALAPFIIQAAEGISKVVDKFNGLDEGTKSSIVQWGALIAAVGPAVFIFGKIVSVVGIVISVLGTVLSVVTSVISFFAGPFAMVLSAIASPIGLAVAAIGTLIAIGVNLYNNWGQVKARAEELGGGIGGYLKAALEETGAMFTRLKDKAVEALEGIRSKWESVKNFLKNPIKGTISIFSKETKSKGSANPDGSHASGLNRVPFDNYLGNLHAGEMVLPAQTANKYRSLGGDIHNIPSSGGGGGVFAPTINVSVSGGTDSGVARDIGQVVRDEMEDMFRNMRLQRA